MSGYIKTQIFDTIFCESEWERNMRKCNKYAIHSVYVCVCVLCACTVVHVLWCNFWDPQLIAVICLYI